MTLVNERARLLANRQVGPNLFIMTLSSPRIAAAIEPGQFVHMTIPAFEAHILRRPFSVYARDVEAGTVEVLYQTVGAGTAHLATLLPETGAGYESELIGPVGRGWRVPQGCARALLVGGGVGAAPLFMLAESLADANIPFEVVLGAQTQAAHVCRDRYDALVAQAQACADAAPRYATDDGSFGRAGFCTGLVEEALAEAEAAGRPYEYVAVCGPEPLMKIASAMAADHGVFCEVSLERRMACGIGACLSCVVDTVDGKKRSCVDGPVFEAEKVVW